MLQQWAIAPSGFEPLSPAPKASMLGHYTTGLAGPRVRRTKGATDAEVRAWVGLGPTRGGAYFASGSIIPCVEKYRRKPSAASS